MKAKHGTKRLLIGLLTWTAGTVYGAPPEEVLTLSGLHTVPAVYEEAAPGGAPRIAGASQDPWYGYRPEQAIPVGGRVPVQHAYLAQLRGTEGEPLDYRRCAQAAPASVDCYEVSYEGLEGTVTLYLDRGRAASLYAPLGFSFVR